MTFPKSFIYYYAPLVDNQSAFLTSLQKPSRASVRVNTLKVTREEVIGRFDGYGIEVTPVDWYADALTTESQELSHTLERFLGTIYIQELASMIPALVIQDLLKQAPEQLTVLDACAAPGSKTTQVAALMNNRGRIIANDKSFSRIRALKFNLDKAGATNVAITNYDLQSFPDMQFDVVLLDAPCSADGTLRKNPELLTRWSVGRLRGYASMQKDLIARALDLLKPGGTMVYSTCSMSVEENEGVVNHLLQTRRARLQEIALPDFALAAPILQVDGDCLNADIAKAGRIWPHHNDTDGFFVARLTK